MINFQRLLDVCKATEELPLGGFDMQVISCGSVGCMIGNYSAMVHRDRSTFGEHKSDWEHFGITRAEYYWLFSRWPVPADSDGWRPRWSDRMDRGYLFEVTRPQALARLRKFIYYKLHKHEMCCSEKYGVREEARRAEGNQNFAARAKAEAERHALIA